MNEKHNNKNNNQHNKMFEKNPSTTIFSKKRKKLRKNERGNIYL